MFLALVMRAVSKTRTCGREWLNSGAPNPSLCQKETWGSPTTMERELYHQHHSGL